MNFKASQIARIAVAGSVGPDGFAHAGHLVWGIFEVRWTGLGSGRCRQLLAGGCDRGQ